MDYAVERRIDRFLDDIGNPLFRTYAVRLESNTAVLLGFSAISVGYSGLRCLRVLKTRRGVDAAIKALYTAARLGH